MSTPSTASYPALLLNRTYLYQNNIGQTVENLTTEQCTIGLLRNVEPFILETILYKLKSGVNKPDAADFVRKHKEHLTVSVHTIEVNEQDALQVSIFIDQGLIDEVLIMLGPYMTNIKTDDVPTGWSDWFKQKALEGATMTASAVLQLIINKLFLNGRLAVSLRVTDMWRPESLRAELLADEAPTAWTYVKAANILYKCYKSIKKQEYTVLDMAQINDLITAIIVKKVHAG